MTAPPTTPTPSPTSAGPTATPVPGTPTPTPAPSTTLFVDETDPNNANQALRKPVWSAGRVLGYTNPLPDLSPNAVPAAASPSGRAPAISVWPGRKMLFSRPSSGVPLLRENFLPATGTCGGVTSACFAALMTDMGLDPASPADQNLAVLTVQFLRGGKTNFGRRDEILNDPSIRPATIGTIGPATGEEQRLLVLLPGRRSRRETRRRCARTTTDRRRPDTPTSSATSSTPSR